MAINEACGRGIVGELRWWQKRLMLIFAGQPAIESWILVLVELLLLVNGLLKEVLAVVFINHLEQVSLNRALMASRL